MNLFTVTNQNTVYVLGNKISMKLYFKSSDIQRDPTSQQSLPTSSDEIKKCSFTTDLHKVKIFDVNYRIVIRIGSLQTLTPQRLRFEIHIQWNLDQIPMIVEIV
jgi:hypothetical protein